MLFDPNQNASEVSYLEIHRALERVDVGESYRTVARPAEHPAGRCQNHLGDIGILSAEVAPTVQYQSEL